MSVNDDIQNAAIRHAIESERYGRGLAKRIVALLNDADEDLTTALEQRLIRIADGTDRGPATTKRLTDLIESLKAINSRVYKRLLATLQTELVDLAEYEMEQQAATLQRILPVPVTAVAPTATFLKTLVETTPIDGHLLKPWVDQMDANRLARVEQQMRIGMVQGETPQQIARRIRGTRANGYKDGILQVSRRSAETLALTANSTIANRAREEVYKKNSNLIRKLKWVSTLDTRTSSTCQSRDGKLYDLDQPHPTPPAHPRCRSVMIPVTVPFRELGLDADDYSPTARASMDGQVPGSTKFGEWFANQSRERQIEIVGKERADLFASGKIKFDEFFNKDDQLYTLAELKARTNVERPAPKASKPKELTLADVNAKHDADLKAYTLEKGLKDGKEHLAIYDALTGRDFPKVSDGKKGSVTFPDWMVEELRNPNNQIVLHHNHPGSSSFSPADLSIVHEFKGAKGIWAHGHNGSSYYAEAGPRKMSGQGYNLLRRQVQEWMQRKVNSKQISTDDANKIYYHVVTRLVEHRGYIVYRADLQGETLEAFKRTEPFIEAFINSIAGHSE